MHVRWYDDLGERVRDVVEARKIRMFQCFDEIHNVSQEVRIGSNFGKKVLFHMALR